MDRLIELSSSSLFDLPLWFMNLKNFWVLKKVSISNVNETHTGYNKKKLFNSTIKSPKHIILAKAKSLKY